MVMVLEVNDKSFMNFKSIDALMVKIQQRTTKQERSKNLKRRLKIFHYLCKTVNNNLNFPTLFL